MFPSTGHFRFMPCPHHLEGHCGRVYCHYRHVKNGQESATDNAELGGLEKQICGALKIDKETFNILVSEEDENVHEKLVNNKLKSRFPGQDEAIDNFHFPESVDDLGFPWASFPTNDTEEELINLTAVTPLDERPLKEFLEKDAKESTNAEPRNKMEKRHMIISCLEKIDKREYPRRPIVQAKSYSNVSADNSRKANLNSVQNTDDISTQPLFTENINFQLKQEQDVSDSSESEDNSEVDKILTQMKLLNPQLFNTDKIDPEKYEPQEVVRNHLTDVLADDDLSSQATQILLSQDCSQTTSLPSRSGQSRVGRINLKSIADINNEFGSDDGTAGIKPENVYQPVSVVPAHPTPDAIMLAATIAEQNRLKNLFKNTICSNIDQFFDMSDACKVYGTEIFNLLEPLLNYLIEKLNPEFNFQKLKQLHTQNMSLSCSLPFVGSCEHAKDCVECHNILMAAMSKNKVKTADKSTSSNLSMPSTNNDTPLRKIEAGLYDITKEMLSLGIPVEDHLVPRVAVETKSVHCQTERNEKHSSSREHRNSDRKETKDKHSSKSSKHRRDSSRHNSNSRHSRSEHRSSKSASSHRREKRRKEDEGEVSNDEEHHEKASKQLRSPNKEDGKKKKRPYSDKSNSVDVKKAKTEKSLSNHEIEMNENNYDSDLDVEESIFGGALSDGSSDSENVADDNRSTDSSSEDEEKRNTKNSDGFVDQVPTTANKKRISHVTEEKSKQVYRALVKKPIPTPAEVMYQRMQNRTTEDIKNEGNSLLNVGGSTSEKIRISHVPNVALLLKAKEQINNIIHKPSTLPVRTTVQTAARGVRVAHIPAEQPKPKDVPLQAHLSRPKITEFKTSHNIPLPIRQNGLDKLYNAYAKKVPPEMASEMALKEEQTIHEKVTIQKVYLNSLAMAVHRIAKENPAKLLEKTSEFPLEISGILVYDLLSRHVLTYEQLEINGFPLPIPGRLGCARISTKAIHYKPLTSKRSGDRFYCQQCKELFDIDSETGLPVTPITGCRFHSMRPRKEAGRTRHELYYPCCNSSITESGCVTAEYHTPDMTDDDYLEGFVETRDAPPGERGTKKFYSLDCEMCFTTEGIELTRVTVIGHDCNTVYDSLVKPRNQILDYCTKFSGITEEKLRRVTKTLQQVRQELFKFIFKDSILIGHSLENDLKALKILHNKIVDTSVMYPHRDAPERKFSLKYLSSYVVQFLIQESEFGHDSKEDALACMKLVWKKIREDAQVYRPKKIISSPAKIL